MARQSRYLYYDEQVNALMGSSHISLISADKNNARGSALEGMNSLKATEAAQGTKDLQQYNQTMAFIARKVTEIMNISSSAFVSIGYTLIADNVPEFSTGECIYVHSAVDAVTLDTI